MHRLAFDEKKKFLVLYPHTKKALLDKSRERLLHEIDVEAEVYINFSLVYMKFTMQTDM